MNPGASTSLDTAADTAAGVLAFARDRRAAADAAEADLLHAACAWADLHPAESIGEAVRFGDTPIPVAGPGAPLAANSATQNSATKGAPGPATGTGVSPNRTASPIDSAGCRSAQEQAARSRSASAASAAARRSRANASTPAAVSAAVSRLVLAPELMHSF